MLCTSTLKSVAAVGVIALAACALETSEVNYDTYAIALKAGALQAGWLPDWLPKDSTRILERHNIDTNARMWVAEVPVGSGVSLPQNCVTAIPASLPAPPFQRSWWPEGVPHRPGPSQEFLFFECGGHFVGLAAQGGKLIGWSLQ
jgi:hypothetical protein